MGLEKKCEEYKEIKSPVVGTFYDSATSPFHEKMPLNLTLKLALMSLQKQLFVR